MKTSTSLGSLLLLFVVQSWAGAQNPPAGTAADPGPLLEIRYGVNKRFGIVVLKDAAGKPVNKQLTYSAYGTLWSNSTVVRIDGKVLEFGGDKGKWVEENVKLPNGVRSTWAAEGVQVSQIVEVVAGKQPVEVAPGVLKLVRDTCLIRYEIANMDPRAHQVGLRMQVDTLIGSNDGVPFAVPGLPALVSTFKDFPQPADVPDFIQALEVPNLQKPGTVGRMTFKWGAGIEAPARVSLVRWPGDGFFAWEVPLTPMGTDSAVALYWNDQQMQPNQKRTVGFAYGLGNLASQAGAGAGAIGITVGGTFEAGQLFAVTTYVSNPVPEQTVTLKLPAGLARIGGKETEPVPAPKDGAKGTSLVTWRVKAAKAGAFTVGVTSSTGVAAAKDVSIAPSQAQKNTVFTVGFPRDPLTFPTIQAAVDATDGPTIIWVDGKHVDPGFLVSDKENIHIRFASGGGAYMIPDFAGPISSTSPPVTSAEGYPEITGLAAVVKSKRIFLSGFHFVGGIRIADSERVEVRSGWVDGGVAVTGSSQTYLTHLNLVKDGAPGILIVDSFLDVKNTMNRWRNFQPLDAPVLPTLETAFGTPAVHVLGCTFSRLNGLPAATTLSSHVRMAECVFSGLAGSGIVAAPTLRPDRSMGPGCLTWVSDCRFTDVVDNGVFWWKSEGLAIGNKIDHVTAGIFGAGNGIEIHSPDPVKGERPPHNHLATGQLARYSNTIRNCEGTGLFVKGSIGPITAYVYDCSVGIEARDYKGRIDGLLQRNKILGIGLLDTPGPVVMDLPFLLDHPGPFSAVLSNAKDVFARLATAPTFVRDWDDPKLTVGGVLIDNSEVNLGKEGRGDGGVTLQYPPASGGLVIVNGSKVEGYVTVDKGMGPGIIVEDSTFAADSFPGLCQSTRNLGEGLLLSNAVTTLKGPVVTQNAGGGILVTRGSLRLTGGSIVGYRGPKVLRGKSFSADDLHPFALRGIDTTITARDTFLAESGRAGVWLSNSQGAFDNCSLSAFRYSGWEQGIKWSNSDYAGLLLDRGAKATYRSGRFHIMGGKGAHVRAGSQLTLSQNDQTVACQALGDNFLHVEDGGIALADNNSIHTQRGHGIKVLAGGKATLKSNHFNVDFADGVYVTDRGEAELTNNDFDWISREVPLHKKTYVALRAEKGAVLKLKNNVGGGKRLPIEAVLPETPAVNQSRLRLRAESEPIAQAKSPDGFFLTAWQDGPEQAPAADPAKSPHQTAREEIVRRLGALRASKVPAAPKPPAPQRGPGPKPGTGSQPGPVTAGPAAVEALSQIAESLARDGQWEEALAAFQQAVQADPKHAHSRLRLGNALLRTNRVSEAIQQYKEGIALSPKDAQLHFHYAGALTLEKSWSEAEKACRVAIALEPTNGDSHLLLASVLLEGGRLVDAAGAAAKAVDVGAKNHWCLEEVVRQLQKTGAAKTQAGQIAEAEAAVRQALGVAPQNAELHALLGKALLRQSRVKEAVVALLRAVELVPSAAAYANLAEAYAALGDSAKAEAALRTAAGLQPGYHETLARFLLQRRQWPDAEVALRNALRFDPKNTRLHGELANVVFKQGRAAEALHLGKQALAQGVTTEQLAPNLRALVAKGSVELKPYTPGEDVARGVPVPNGDFEAGLTKPWGTGQFADGRPIWWNSGACKSTAEADRRFHKSGEMSLHIVNPTARAAHVFGTTQQEVRIVPNQRYRIRLWARAEKLASKGAVSIIVDKEWKVRPILFPSGTYDWTQFSGTFSLPENVAQIRITSEDMGEAWLDDIELEADGSTGPGPDLKIIETDLPPVLIPKPALPPARPEQPRELLRLGGHTQPVLMAAFSPDGKALASASSDGAVRVLDWAKGQLRHTLRGHKAAVYFIAYSPDGLTLASSGPDATVILWDTETGKQRAQLNDHADVVNQIVFSPDGKILATASNDRTVKLRDGLSGEVRTILKGCKQHAIALAFSPDGKRLACGGGAWANPERSGEVKIWDVATGEIIVAIDRHDVGGIWSVAFSPDGRTLAGASLGGAVRTWDATTGKELAVLQGHTERVMWVAFSPDGRTLGSASWDKTVCLWDPLTGKKLVTLRGHTAGVERCAFSPDGVVLASPSLDRSVCLWRLAGDAVAPRKGDNTNVVLPAKPATNPPDNDRIPMPLPKPQPADNASGPGPDQVLVFKDDFERSKLPALSLFGSSVMTFRNNNSKGILTGTAAGVLPAMYQDLKVKDFIAEVEFRVKAGSPDSDYGLVFRATPGADGGLAGYYALLINPAKSTAALLCWQNPTWTLAKSYPLKNGTVALDRSNHVRLEAVGGRFRLHLNKAFVFDLQDDKLSGPGQFGLCANAGSAEPNTVEFVNLRLYEPGVASDAFKDNP